MVNYTSDTQQENNSEIATMVNYTSDTQQEKKLNLVTDSWYNLWTNIPHCITVSSRVPYKVDEDKNIQHT